MLPSKDTRRERDPKNLASAGARKEGSSEFHPQFQCMLLFLVQTRSVPARLGMVFKLIYDIHRDVEGEGKHVTTKSTSFTSPAPDQEKNHEFLTVFIPAATYSRQ